MSLERSTIQFMEPGNASEPEGQHLYLLIASETGGPEGYSTATIVALTQYTPQPTPPTVLVEGEDTTAALDRAIEEVEAIGDHADWEKLEHRSPA